VVFRLVLYMNQRQTGFGVRRRWAGEVAGSKALFLGELFQTAHHFVTGIENESECLWLFIDQCRLPRASKPQKSFGGGYRLIQSHLDFMPKQTWIIASVLTAALLLGLFAFTSWSGRQELEQLRAELNSVKTQAAKDQGQLLAQADGLKAKLDETQARVQELQQEKENVVQQHRSLEDEMRAALQSKDVTISQLQGKLTVNILDRILFDSGEADLKPGGAAVLSQVAGVLAQHPNLKVHVIGHTDNVPIKAAARARFPSNWELSTTRATAAVRYLVEKAGVDPRRLGAVGYGEFRPMADNNTPEGRARNRRIAITILSEELAGADVVPTVSTNVAAAICETNSPAVEQH
jgi:chemotaxis protein MotB